jgi:hypothetical protein
MSINVTDAQILDFIDEIQEDYQAKQSTLTELVKSKGALVKMGVNGESTSVPRIGKIAMKARGALQSEITPNNTDFGRIPILLENKVTLELSDVFANEVIDFDEKQQLVKAMSNALARDKDQAVIDALDINTYNPVASPAESFLIDDNANMLSVANLITAAERLDDLGVPAEGRILLTSAKGKSQLFQDEKFINSDYVTEKRLTDNSTSNYYMGFEIIVMPNTYDENGVKINGLDTVEVVGIHTSYIFHAESVACVYGKVVDRITFQWVNNLNSHSILAASRRGSAVIKKEGIVQLFNNA